MKTEKLYKLTIPSGEYFGKTISAIMDILDEQKHPIPHWKIWKLPKEIGDRHELTEFQLTLEILPIYLHENPRKGQYPRK